MEVASPAWDSGRFNRRVSTFAHISILITLMVFWLIVLKGVLQPFFIALGIYFVLKPGSDYLSSNGFPLILSYLTMVLFTLLLVSAASFVAYQQASDLVEDEEKMELYNSKLESRWSDIKQSPLLGMMLSDDSDATNTTLVEDLAAMGLLEDEQKLSDAAMGMLSNVGVFFTTSVTVMFFLIFIIFEASLLPGRIERAWPDGGSQKVQIMRSKIEASVNTYIIVKTGVGAGTALCAGLVMLSFGIDLWFTWALITFLLNYVPYIGSLIATLPPIVIGLILLEPNTLILLILLLLSNQQIWGQIIETKWAGRALDLSPVLLLLVTAISFAGWGILGMILAVPFAVIIKIVLENIEATQPFAILMSERAPSIDEAWDDAIRDGKISNFESQSLNQLQMLLGYSDRHIKLIAGRITAQRALSKNKISDDQMEIIFSAADTLGSDNEIANDITTLLSEGKLDKGMRPLLTNFIAALEEE
ncbi:MAG: AI-2E family transporter [Euryarchaeota archaeon]|jgi:predicted PurR-regulated permease PerM|nr:AI-2E family transporter [Euryarchaeota archaeon]MBT5595013.1 AI-2E family transporter [Euryarchaeota archaeon]MBT5844136.1 AI-2E family transporter [Euryarchaeota archaeon]MBT6640765.1 AI-2E family transporter [Euryarchaeota archaeon]MBT6845587.1 AI-2E family transporter [Euryarchaeota archaeon]